MMMEAERGGFYHVEGIQCLEGENVMRVSSWDEEYFCVNEMHILARNVRCESKLVVQTHLKRKQVTVLATVGRV